MQYTQHVRPLLIGALMVNRQVRYARVTTIFCLISLSIGFREAKIVHHFFFWQTGVVECDQGAGGGVYENMILHKRRYREVLPGAFQHITQIVAQLHSR